MVNLNFFYKNYPGNLITGLTYLYGSKISSRPIEEFNRECTNSFYSIHFSRDIKDYLYSYDFINDAREIINTGGTILIDYTLEADTVIRPCIVYLLENIKEAQLPIDSFKFVYNNSESIEPTFISIREYKLQTLYFPFLYVEAHRQQNEYFKPTGEVYDSNKAVKDFLMLNRRVGTNKFIAIHELVKRGWRDRSLMTFVDMRPNLKIDIKTNQDWLDTLEKLGLTYPITAPLQLEGDVEYGTGLAWSDEFLYTVNPKWYEQAKINIIVETWSNSTIPGSLDSWSNIVHHTEKVFKPIGFNSPFVVYSGKNYLDRLHKLGFRTDFLSDEDNDYDNEDDDKRLAKVLDLADKYSRNYDSERMKEVCLHNQNQFLNINNLKDIVKKYFLDAIIKEAHLI